MKVIFDCPDNGIRYSLTYWNGVLKKVEKVEKTKEK